MPVPQRLNFLLVGSRGWASSPPGTGKMTVPQRLNFLVVGTQQQARCLFHKD
ncbi:hypothetical protein QUB70_27800 [Microcoleus sp. A003_D6]